ncbi:unnamed protein product [Echinostoma caproni]|uniref:DUF5746 domain-containing protein n=1 Tax=Echinostoma caproni TaxID=27848 RepID=A0A183AEX9_9TREM|nr:unnamed protein product [Echinostoma caproni]
MKKRERWEQEEEEAEQRVVIAFQASAAQPFRWTQCAVWTTVLSLLTATFVGLCGLATFHEKPRVIRSTKEELRCYTCDNYASVGSGGRPGAASGLAWMGGKPVLTGQTAQSNTGSMNGGMNAIQASRLCAEKVNRTAMRALITSKSYGLCSGVAFDGCAKIVTKSYRIKPQAGTLILSAVVVSRTCAHIPEGLGIGCFDTVGGAEIRQRICYCRGPFCNGTAKNKAITGWTSLLIILTHWLFNH